jgi:hypothetical protein
VCSSDLHFGALLANDLHGDTTVLLDAQKFAPGRRFRLMASADASQIQLGTPRDKGGGWLMATYTEIQTPT